MPSDDHAENPANDDRERVLALLRRYGWNATSFQVLERGFRYWFAGDDACVAYVDTGGAWVAAGAPIAAPDRLAATAAAFVEAARAQRRRACFFATEPRFFESGGLESLPIGEQPTWDPSAWDATLRGSKSLREQLRRARAKGVTVRALEASEVAPGASMRSAIEGLVARWMRSRPMAPMGFLVDVQPFEHADERRYFVAEHEGRLVGFLAVVPIYARGGWFLEDLLRDPSAPNGTPESLVDAAMRRAAEEGSAYVTLGLAPLAGSMRGWLRTARERLSFFYDFEGLRAFKARLRPNGWDPIYLAHPRGASGTLALYDSLAAFARGSFARFAVQTALRGPAIVVRMLAILLIPWTILLALPRATRYFPSAAVQRGWVGFDIVLAVALFVLAAKWRPALARVLAAAITMDAALTVTQSLVWNARHVHSASDTVVIAMACLAPSAAAVILWSALRVREERFDRNDGS